MMDGLDAALPLGSLVPCPNCAEGLLHAGYGGDGEVDCYFCDTCKSGIVLTYDEVFELEHPPEACLGMACDVAKRGWWLFSDKRR